MRPVRRPIRVGYEPVVPVTPSKRGSNGGSTFNASASARTARRRSTAPATESKRVAREAAHLVRVRLAIEERIALRDRELLLEEEQAVPAPPERLPKPPPVRACRPVGGELGGCGELVLQGAVDPRAGGARAPSGGKKPSALACFRGGRDRPERAVELGFRRPPIGLVREVVVERLSSLRRRARAAAGREQCDGDKRKRGRQLRAEHATSSDART
jgi:hypothetical protein